VFGLEDKTWLELASGKTVPIEGSCSIGRAPSNHVVLDDEHVSRQHAAVRMAGPDGCWIVDLGSANGTYVNQRRITAQRLRDGDTIIIGSCLLVFRSSADVDQAVATALTETVHDIRPIRAWLFVVDIEGSSGIGRRLGALRMEQAYNEWLTHCRTILHESGGIFDKPLGDGFFAFWPAGEGAGGGVARALLAFKQYQSNTSLPFRMVLHLGTAFTGGEIASGMYRLFGADVNFTFRMETLAKTLGARCLVSSEAREALGRQIEPESGGSHKVPGLEGSYTFFRL
jgi:adenylate cyclase